MPRKCTLVIRHRDTRKDVKRKIKKMKEKYIDVVSSELFKHTNAQEILTELNIETIYVVKEIKTKEDVDFVFPKSKNLKPAFLFTDLSLYNTLKNKLLKDSLILGRGGSLSANTNILTTKSSIHLFDPISFETSFDEGLSRLSKQNQKIIFFNINDIYQNTHKAIKQMQFIIPILKKHKIEMRFITFAKNPEELIDPIILQEFLKNFNLEKPLIKRILQEKI